METFFIVVGTVIAIWIIFLLIYNSKLKYLQHGLVSRLHTASDLIINGADIVIELQKNNINCNVDEREGFISWGYQSFPDWYFTYHPKQKMITLNCTLANKKYNMVTLWSHFDNNSIDLSWSINRHNFAGQLNQDAVVFIKNLYKYGVHENKDMNY